MRPETPTMTALMEKRTGLLSSIAHLKELLSQAAESRLRAVGDRNAADQLHIDALEPLQAALEEWLGQHGSVAPVEITKPTTQLGGDVSRALSFLKSRISDGVFADTAAERDLQGRLDEHLRQLADVHVRLQSLRSQALELLAAIDEVTS
jgi:hypothetical protein